MLVLVATSVTSAQASTNSNVLHGLTAISSSDVWATGYYISGTIHRTLAEHWDGTAWSVVLSPSPGTRDDFFNTPVGISSNDVWVAGSRDGRSGEGAGSRTLIEHWNGSSWSVASSPNVSGTNQDILRGAAASSSTDVWAVGRSKGTGTVKRTLIEHWNGTAWQIVPSPNVNSEGDALEAATAISPAAVWAVGSGTRAGTPISLTEHWDGTSWSVVPSPNPGIGGAYPQGTLLWAVSGTASTDAWAVGQYYDGSAVRTLVLHWNGQAWTQMPSPNVGSGENQLRTVAALSATDAWAVGWSNVSGTYHTLVEHWDGTSWTIVPSADAPAADSYLKGVAAVSASDIWAAAYSAKGGIYQTLTEHWDSASWTIVPSPNV